MKNNAAFELALKNFPRWMDIRKRKNKSIGSMFLKSMTDEAEEVEAAIEAMRKTFFASNYRNNAISTVDYLMSVSIGKVEISKIEIIEPSLPITDEYKVFISNESDYALYQEDTIFISFDLNVKKLKYKIDGHTYESTLSLYHAWNTIDEFALYSGIERLELERDHELLERIFLVYKQIPNSSELGLKNAIINEISGKVDLLPSEIEIERLSETNFHNTTSSGDYAGEVIIENDHDVYRTKVWDKSRWSHPFKKLTYSKHKWDEPIEVKQDGTGHLNNLKVSLFSEIENKETTDIEINAYKMSAAHIENYVKNNNKPISLPMQLKRYRNELSPADVRYRIVAETARELKEEVIFEGFYEESGEFTLPLEEIVVDRADKMYEVVPGGQLKEGETYKVSLSSRGPYKKMNIKSIMYTDSSSEVEHASVKEGFHSLNGSIESTRTSYFANKKSELYFSKNIRDLAKGGFALSDAALKGEVQIDVSGIENKYLKYVAKCELSDITSNKSFVKSTGFVEKNNEWHSDSESGSIVIEGIFSEISFLISEGNVTIEKTVEDNKETFFSNSGHEERAVFESPKKVKYVIKKIQNSGDTVIKAIRYSRYEINPVLSSGKLVITPQGIAIPKSQDADRFLTIHVKTYTGFSPTIDYIYIGSTVSQVIYETPEFVAGPQAQLRIESDCLAKLTNVTTGEVINGYETITVFRNHTSEAVFLEIDRGKFESIDQSEPLIKTFSYKNEIGYFIEIQPGKSAASIKIKGTLLKLNERVKLQDFLGAGTYIVGNRKKCLYVKDSNEKQITISKSAFSVNSSVINISGLKDDVECVFVVNGQGETSGNTIKNPFDYLYIRTKSSDEYVMHGADRIASRSINNIDVKNRFYPKLDVNKLIVYHIDKSEESHEDTSVLFESTSNDFSIGLKPIKIEASVDFVEKQFTTQDKEVEHNFILSNYMVLPDSFNDQEDLLSEYIISLNEDFELLYEKAVSGLESYYVKNDGFNKLVHSNSKKIVQLIDSNGSPISEDEIYFLKEEGILQWKDLNRSGDSFTIQYEYDRPAYIKPVDESVLYKYVGYTIDTLEHIGTILYQGLKESKPLIKEERDILAQSDHVTVSSMNPLIKAEVVNDVIKLEKDKNYEGLLVEPGYHYSENKEWYYFLEREEKQIGGNTGIGFHEVEKLNGELLFSQASKNYVASSNMLSDDMRKLMDYSIDPKEKGLSNLNAITSCDSFHMWTLFDSDLTFTSAGRNGKGIYYLPHQSHSYAIMEITEWLYDSCMISLYAKGDISAYIGIHTDRNFNDVFCETVAPMEKEKDYFHYGFNELNRDNKYYLVIKGEGVIDDMIIGEKSSNLEDTHTKLLDKKFFNIYELEESEEERKLIFDNNFNSYNQSEIDYDGFIKTSNDIEWGLTKIGEIDTDWPTGVISSAEIVKGDYLKTEKVPGVYQTKIFEIPKLQNVTNVYVKINDILFEEMSDFTINVLTSDDEKINYRTAVNERRKNTLKIPGSKLDKYLKLVVEMPKDKVIENITVYCEYREEPNNIRTRTYNKGHMISKIYDIGSVSNIELKRVNYVKKGEVDIYVRGVRQNKKDLVFTSWKKLELDDKGAVSNYVYFESYDMLQFKTDLLQQVSAIKIDSYEIGVVR